ncbi:hypothetical protein [Emticicia sp. SJ17W-69]|uniref:hypothetical protein n=1 Tax=Emticicia sp. SJ17W-69 TaxID=3421657 RepID=UPI003EBB0B98
MPTKRSLSLIVQAIYVFITAVQLIFVPNMLLSMFGFPPTSEIWIKVLGIVLITLAIVYYGIIKFGNAEVVKYTIWGRITVGIGFVILVLLGQTLPALILFAGIDIITAVWTWFELK